MLKKKILIFSLLAVFQMFFVTGTYASESAVQKNSILDFLGKYCQLEFTGDNPDGRHDFIKLTNSYEAKLKRLGEMPAGVLNITGSYIVFAVKSYKILDVSVSGNKAIATISYDVLAKKTGWIPHGPYYEGVLFAEYKKPNYIEKIKLNFDGKRWWVLDPPFPKISIGKVISFYEQEVALFAKNNLPGPASSRSEQNRRDMYGDDTRSLTLLKKLAQ